MPKKERRANGDGKYQFRATIGRDQDGKPYSKSLLRKVTDRMPPEAERISKEARCTHDCQSRHYTKKLVGKVSGELPEGHHEGNIILPVSIIEKENSR